MTKQGLTWLVPGLMQIPVNLALSGVGFNFIDLYSTVLFLYAYHFIMVAFQGFFRFFFHQDDETACLPIKIFNAGTRVTLQIWGFITVFCFVWQNDYNSCKKTTVISGIIIVTIELFLVVSMLVNIYKQLGGRMSKCFLGKSPQRDEMKSTNSRTPKDNNESNKDRVRLLTANNSDTENEIY